MDTGFLIRAVDAFFTAILWLIAGSGVLVVSATGQAFALLVGMAIVLEGAVLARWVLRH